MPTDDDREAWAKRLEKKLCRVSIVADMWATGECTPEFALRSIRREIRDVVEAMIKASKAAGE